MNNKGKLQRNLESKPLPGQAKLSRNANVKVSKSQKQNLKTTTLNKDRSQDYFTGAH
jgi:hypothetical protein